MTSKTLDILCYHAVTPGPRPLNDFCFMPVETFRAHMRWLQNSRFEVRPLKAAAADLAAGRLRRRTVAITFDDGFRNNISVALPVLEAFGLPATIFLSTGLVGTTSTTWAGRLTRALIDTTAERVDYGGETLPLASVADREAANRTLQRMVKEIAPFDPSGAVLDLEARLDVVQNPDVTGDPDFEMMQPADVDRALATGLIDFGGHSVTHPILSALDDGQLAREVNESVGRVAAMTRRRCETFAYPNGRPVDFDWRTLALLRDAGVSTAVTTTELANTSGADPLRLSRWVLGGGVRLPRLRATLAGLHPDQLKHRFRALTSAAPQGS